MENVNNYKLTTEIKEKKEWLELEESIKKLKLNIIETIKEIGLEDFLICSHTIHNKKFDLILPDPQEKRANEKRSLFGSKKESVVFDNSPSFHYSLEILMSNKAVEINSTEFLNLFIEKLNDRKLSKSLKLEKI